MRTWQDGRPTQWRVVQLAERLTLDQEVAGSSPAPPATLQSPPAGRRGFRRFAGTAGRYTFSRCPRSLEWSASGDCTTLTTRRSTGGRSRWPTALPWSSRSEPSTTGGTMRLSQEFSAFIECCVAHDVRFLIRPQRVRFPRAGRDGPTRLSPTTHRHHDRRRRRRRRTTGTHIALSWTWTDSRSHSSISRTCDATRPPPPSSGPRRSRRADGLTLTARTIPPIRRHSNFRAFCFIGFLSTASD